MPTKQSAGKKTESNDEKTIKRLQGEKKKLEEQVKILSKQFDFKSVPNEVIEGYLRDLYEEKYKVLYEEMEALKRSSGKNEGQSEKERAETAKSDAKANKEIGQLQSNYNEVSTKNKRLSDELDTLKKEIDELTKRSEDDKIVWKQKLQDETEKANKLQQNIKEEKAGSTNSVNVNVNVNAIMNQTKENELEIKSNKIHKKELEVCKREGELDERESQITSKGKALDQREKDLKTREECLNNKESDLHHQQTEIAILKADIEKREKDIRDEQAKLQNENSPLDSSTGLKDELTKKEKEIEKLKEDLTGAKRQIEELQTKDKTSTGLKEELTKKEKEIEKLKEDLTGAKSTGLKDELAKKEKEIEKLKEDVKRQIEELQTKDKTSTGLKEELTKKEKEIEKLKEDLTGAKSAGLKDELANKEKDIAKLNKALTDVKSDLTEKEKEVEKLGGDLSRAISKLDKEKAKNDSSNSRSKSANVFRQQLEAANHEIEELKTRLSKVMGANITDNNPDIADLSDLNRPTKLAEKYSELYDNEWTDAFEEIENDGVKEVDAIKRLFDILKDVYKFCNQVSVNYTKSIKASALLIPGTDNGRPNTANLPATSRKQITELRKTFAPSLAGDVFKQYLKTTKQSLDKCPQTKRYIKACVDLCWLMSIQDPPVVLDLGDSSGKFDGDKYKTYTRTGKTLDYVVWPPLRLHDGGALLYRGVAQGK